MIAGLILALTTVALPDGVTTPTVDQTRLVRTVHAVNDDFMRALSRHDPALVAAAYADDAIWTDGKKFHLQGRRRIQDFWAERLAKKFQFVRGSCTSKIAWSDAQSGLEIGSCESTFKTAKGEKRSGGRFATLWRRQPDGSWKIAANYTP